MVGQGCAWVIRFTDALLFVRNLWRDGRLIAERVVGR